MQCVRCSPGDPGTRLSQCLDIPMSLECWQYQLGRELRAIHCLCASLQLSNSSGFPGQRTERTGIVFF